MPLSGANPRASLWAVVFSSGHYDVEAAILYYRTIIAATRAVQLPHLSISGGSACLLPYVLYDIFLPCEAIRHRRPSVFIIGPPACLCATKLQALQIFLGGNAIVLCVACLSRSDSIKVREKRPDHEASCIYRAQHHEQHSDSWRLGRRVTTNGPPTYSPPPPPQFRRDAFA